MAALDLDTIADLPLEQRVLGPILRARAERDHARVYMRFGDHHWTFGETYDVVLDAARGLLQRGLSKGDRVGLFMPNLPAFIFAWWGTNLAGGVTVPINPNFTASLLDYCLRDADVRILVTTATLMGVVDQLPADTRARLKLIVLTEDPGHPTPDAPGLISFGSLCALGRARGNAIDVALDFRSTHSIMYTSGTTGPSKGAVVPNGHYFAASCTFIRAVALTRDDVLFTPLPLFHGLASRLGALPSWMVGAEYVLAPRFSASQFWRQVTECHATVAQIIFTLPAMLKAQPPGAFDRAHRLRAMYNCNYDKEFEARFGVHVCEAFGLTEVGLTHYTRFPERRPGSCGKTHEDWEAKLVDERGLDVPPGQVGEIVLRPRLPSIMMDGYVNKPDETLRAMRDLWFHSGDYARMDADGYFYFASRAKDRIRRRGENVTPQEVEAILCQHPAIGDCAAVAHPAREGEDDIRVVLVAKPGVTAPLPTEIMDWLGGRMPYFMMPRYIEFAAALPRNPVGKVEKYKLIDAGLAGDAWDREAAGYVVRREMMSASSPAGPIGAPRTGPATNSQLTEEP